MFIHLLKCYVAWSNCCILNFSVFVGETHHDMFIFLTGSSYNFIGPEFASEASLYQVGRKDFTIMMPLSEVQTPGYVTAFRLFGAAVGGIHIQVLKYQIIFLAAWYYFWVVNKI